MPVDFQIGDIVRLRKPHPCGGYDWEIVRLGADIGLKCQTCQHRVLLTRRELEKRFKTFVHRAADPADTSSPERAT
jgi:hypothetical protein